jgi:hypothetical protein
MLLSKRPADTTVTGSIVSVTGLKRSRESDTVAIRVVLRSVCKAPPVLCFALGLLGFAGLPAARIFIRGQHFMCLLLDEYSLPHHVQRRIRLMSALDPLVP